RDSFAASEEFPEPHVILAVAVVCAESDERADFLASTMDLVWVRLRRGVFDTLPSPEEASAYPYTPEERAVADSYRELQIVGSPEAVRARLAAIVEDTGADELMITSTIHDHRERLRSYELVAAAFQ